MSLSFKKLLAIIGLFAAPLLALVVFNSLSTEFYKAWPYAWLTIVIVVLPCYLTLVPKDSPFQRWARVMMPLVTIPVVVAIYILEFFAPIFAVIYALAVAVLYLVAILTRKWWPIWTVAILALMIIGYFAYINYRYGCC